MYVCVTGTQGRVVSFKNAIIILTSNLGSAEIFNATYKQKKEGGKVAGGLLSAPTVHICVVGTIRFGLDNLQLKSLVLLYRNPLHCCHLYGQHTRASLCPYAFAILFGCVLIIMLARCSQMSVSL